jgi:hypothetical protein
LLLIWWCHKRSLEVLSKMTIALLPISAFRQL